MHKVSRRTGGAEPNRRWRDAVPFAELRSGVNRHSFRCPVGSKKFAGSWHCRSCSLDTAAPDLSGPRQGRH